MTAVAVLPRERTEVLQWLAPAPLWDDAVAGAGDGLSQPWIAEISQDRFVDAFTAILSGATGSPATALAATRPARTTDGSAASAYRLFQPLSMRHYVVTATLVCRRPGIPDHTVALSDGERACFVMRRLDGDDELAFVPGIGGTPGSWVTALGDALVPGEQEHSMHPTPVTPYAAPGTTAAALGLGSDAGSGRQVWFGYVPVGLRDSMARPMADPAGALAALLASRPDIKRESPALGQLVQRVAQPWQHLIGADSLGGTAAPVPNVDYASLYLLLDLGDWLKTYVPTVHAAVLSGTAPANGPYKDLFDALKAVTVKADGSNVTLDVALRDTAPYLPLLTGEDKPGPATTYDLTTVPAAFVDKAPGGGVLAGKAQLALAVAKPPLSLPPELEGMIVERPEPSAQGAAGAEPAYVIRTVLLHEPCEPVLSARSRPFELARPHDPDAPARKVLLQMPDIRNMRAFNRGVAIEMSPSLRKVMDRVTPKTLKGELNGDAGFDLGMICAFSLQIILNLVFWWLPFLKICFPVPVPEKPVQGPQP